MTAAQGDAGTLKHQSARKKTTILYYTQKTTVTCDGTSLHSEHSRNRLQLKDCCCPLDLNAISITSDVSEPIDGHVFFMHCNFCHVDTAFKRVGFGQV